jgi:hypothetical protein
MQSQSKPPALTRRQLQNRLAVRREIYVERLIAYLLDVLSDRAMARTGVLATLDPETFDQVIRALVPPLWQPRSMIPEALREE